MTAAKREMREPSVNPDTIMERIAEVVRMVAALTSEVCEASTRRQRRRPTFPGQPRLEHVDHVHQRLMMAHAQLARALAPPEEIDAEAARGLATLKSGHPDLHHVVASFLADIASYPGDGTWNVHSHLPSRYLLPPEPSEVERRRLERALKTAAAERMPRVASWCGVRDEDEDTNADGAS